MRAALRRHAGLVAFLALLAPLVVAFCWHGVLAAVGDDSMSYVVLARHLSPLSTDARVEPWVRFYTHFPPLFPALLALTGGAWSFFTAHMVVGACALLGAAMVYAYGAERLGSVRAGIALAVVFVSMPTAWVSITGILSEPLYLALSLAALAWHAGHERDPSLRDALVLSLLVAASCLTRVAAVALLAAYAVHLSVRAISRREWPPARSFLPLVLPIACQLAWLELRPPLPADSRGYQIDLLSIVAHWLQDPMGSVAASWTVLSGGWVASFTADSVEPLPLRILLGAIGALGLAGAVRGAMRNRLDSWYVLASGAMLFIWIFAEDNQRRLMYPVVPLVLSHAAEALRALVERIRAERAGLAISAGAFVVVVLCLPAMLLVARKSLDRAPLVRGFEYSPSAMTRYYSTVNVGRAMALAREDAAVLAGFESIERETPAGSRVMWMRPEYVAVLGKREAVPWYYRWTRAEFAKQVHRTGTGYVVASWIFKTDLVNDLGDGYHAITANTPGYLHVASVIPGPDPASPLFAIYKVDTGELERVLAKGSGF